MVVIRVCAFGLYKRKSGFIRTHIIINISLSLHERTCVYLCGERMYNTSASMRMQGREFGLYIYTSMRVHDDDMRICVFVSISLRHLYAYTQKWNNNNLY